MPLAYASIGTSQPPIGGPAAFDVGYFLAELLEQRVRDSERGTFCREAECCIVVTTQQQHPLCETPMSIDFGEMLQTRRAELRLSLRDCAIRADMDPGNLSRIERGRATPPQNPEILARLVDALELNGTEEGQKLIDVAAMQNGRIPRDILSNEEVMSALPVLLRTVNNKQLDGAHIEKLVDMIRNA